MEKQYELNNCSIRVYFYDRLVKIEEATEIKKYLSHDIEARTSALVHAIKLDYSNFFGKELKVKPNSMAVEIWGHVAGSMIANLLENILKIKLVKKLASSIKKRSDSIDCGERGIDQNRSLWDVLANFKTLLVFCLPKKLKNKGNLK